MLFGFIIKEGVTKGASHLRRFAGNVAGKLDNTYSFYVTKTVSRRRFFH